MGSDSSDSAAKAVARGDTSAVEQGDTVAADMVAPHNPVDHKQ